MATYIDGQVHKSTTMVGYNGFVVGINPVLRDKFKVKGGDSWEASDRTMENVYRYPPNRPNRRATREPKQSGRLTVSARRYRVRCILIKWVAGWGGGYTPEGRH
jgi:hypothetical protein